MIIRNPESPLALLGSGEDSRAFDFFQANGISMLSNGFRCDFWERLVIQTAHANPAIFRSIVALSTLLEDFSRWKINWGVGLQAPPNEQTRSALKHYGVALRQLSNHLRGTESMNVISLTSCLLFSCIESLLGNVPAASQLATAGLKILSQAESTNIDLGSSGPLQSFWPVFMRTDSFFVQLRRTLAPDYRPPFIFLPFRTVPSSFSKLSEASFYLESLVNMSQHLGSSDGDDSGWLLNLDACRVLFAQWIAAFDQLVEHAEMLDENERRSLHVCHIWRLNTSLTLNGPQEGARQVEWDNHEQSFRELLMYASTLSGLDTRNNDDKLTSFSLGGGIFFPIVGLGFRCRDPTMRRSAISLLFRRSEAEGPLLGPIAARILERIVAIEENGLGQVTSSSDVPESARVTSVSVRLRGRGNGAEITYSRLMNLDSRVRIMGFTLPDGHGRH
ncbi:hypothetical protein B0J13DRAFT_612666 [Dactylonectria estremocensis]|uniref:Uncharacterized protein n=1 Tax=Dactylonectria estremocensis TaxID=1079267 RepID=A0A9P9DJC9_9HYPO|nr:hypothetical protein B0J13DRAFT_612666 [Dactylonectria estremocensis]